MSGGDGISIEIIKVQGSRMGSFEVTLDNINFFSKLVLGYFPDPTLLANRIKEYLSDVADGKDVEKYKETNGSLKFNDTARKEASKSPVKKQQHPVSGIMTQPEKYAKKEIEMYNSPKKGEKKANGKVEASRGKVEAGGGKVETSGGKVEASDKVKGSGGKDEAKKESPSGKISP